MVRVEGRIEDFDRLSVEDWCCGVLLAGEVEVTISGWDVVGGHYGAGNVEEAGEGW